MTEDSEYIRQLRQQHNITVVRLSELTDIPQEKIAKFERGDIELPKETVEVLVKALDRREM